MQTPTPKREAAVEGPLRRFFTLENEREILEKGYTVVEGVFDDVTCDSLVQKLWDAIEKAAFLVRRDDPETWGPNSWPHSLHGIIQGYGIGQCQAVWDVRQDPRLVETWEEIYSSLWGIPREEVDLVTSMDAICFAKDAKMRTSRNKPWVHTDQDPIFVDGGVARDESRIHKGLRCVQGVMNLLDSDENDGGTYVYPYSHRCHQKFFDHYKPKLERPNWFKFSDKHAAYLEKLKKDASPFMDGVKGPFPITPLKICAKKGSLILFDSRTHHEAKLPNARPKGAPRKLRRAVVYTCMSQRSLQTPQSMLTRRNAMALFRTTSHWPHDPKLFDDYNRYDHGNTRHLEAPPLLTRLGRRIAGLEEGEEWPTKGFDPKGNELRLEDFHLKRENQATKNRAIKEKKKQKASKRPSKSEQVKEEEEEEEEEEEVKEEEEEEEEEEVDQEAKPIRKKSPKPSPPVNNKRPLKTKQMPLMKTFSRNSKKLRRL